MNGIVLRKDGEKRRVEWTDVEEPARPGAGEVTVAIKQAGLNHLDLWVKQGLPGMEVEFPFIMGSDGAGHVIETGEDVSQFVEGDRVLIQPGIYCGTCEFCREGQQSQCVDFGILGETEDGVQRERVTVDRDRVYPVPGDLTLTEASVLPVAYLTAYRMIFTRSDVSPGDTLLIHGAGSGVSVACLQLADLAGLDTIVTSHDNDKLSVANDLGATETIPYDSEDVSSSIRSITNGRGVDLVVDHVGKATWQTSIQSVRKGGTIVTCGATSGANPSTDIQRIFWKQINIHGSTMGTPNEFEALLDLIERGRFKPYVDRVFDAGAIHEAHDYMGNQRQMGKVSIRINEEGGQDFPRGTS